MVTLCRRREGCWPRRRSSPLSGVWKPARADFTGKADIAARSPRDRPREGPSRRGAKRPYRNSENTARRRESYRPSSRDGVNISGLVLLGRRRTCRATPADAQSVAIKSTPFSPPWGARARGHRPGNESQPPAGAGRAGIAGRRTASCERSGASPGRTRASWSRTGKVRVAGELLSDPTRTATAPGDVLGGLGPPRAAGQRVARVTLKRSADLCVYVVPRRSWCVRKAGGYQQPILTATARGDAGPRSWREVLARRERVRAAGSARRGPAGSTNRPRGSWSSARTFAAKKHTRPAAPPATVGRIHRAIAPGQVPRDDQQRACFVEDQRRRLARSLEGSGPGDSGARDDGETAASR
jgi:hypothetical protein